MTTAQTFEQRLRNRAAGIGQLLEHILANEALADEIVRPDRLLAAMRHGVLNGGKRLRPFLVVESAAVFGGSALAASRVGAALECLHCYSLVHDDLPAMDDDDLRRGQPTVHIAFDEATAILAGDALLTLAFDIIEWQRLRAGQGSFADYADFTARRSAWPGMELLHRKGEDTLDGVSPAQVAAYFGKMAPQTGTGALGGEEAAVHQKSEATMRVWRPWPASRVCSRPNHLFSSAAASAASA